MYVVLHEPKLYEVKKENIPFINDYTRTIWVTFSKEKSEYFSMFNIFKAQLKNKIYLKIKFFIFDRGGKFILDEFDELYENYGIIR